MASGGDRPRLPDTDDPYVLLGIDTDADDVAIRKAYARLIKIYRPDRSPSEFQRIHAAYEIAKHGRDDTVPHVDERPAPRPEPARPVVDDATLSRKVAQRFAEVTPDSAQAIVEELLADVPLDLLAITDVPPELLRVLSWSRLKRASDDVRAIAALHEAAWNDAFERDLARAHALLADDALLLDAAEHVSIAVTNVSRIGALAWRHAFAAEELLERYRLAAPRHPRIDWVLDSVAYELAAAKELRGKPLGEFGELAVNLAIAVRLGTRAEIRIPAAKLHAALARDVTVTLAELQRLQTRCDLGPLFELIYSYLPTTRCWLDRLGEDRFNALSAALHAVGHAPYAWPIGGAMIVSGIAIAYFVSALGMLIAAAPFVFAFVTERLRYTRTIQPALARAILDVPVTADVVARWIRINPRRVRGQLGWFTLAVDNDAPLYAMSMLAAFAADLGELDTVG